MILALLAALMLAAGCMDGDAADPNLLPKSVVNYPIKGGLALHLSPVGQKERSHTVNTRPRPPRIRLAGP